MKIIMNSNKINLKKYNGKEIKLIKKLSSLDVSAIQLYKCVMDNGIELIVSEKDYKEIE